MNKRKIYLRGDGNSLIGMGHIMRLISISYYFKETFCINFALIDSDSEVEKLLCNQNINFINYRAEEDFIRKIQGGDVIFIDGYKFTSDYFKKIKLKNCHLIYIDDLQDRDLSLCDIVINHTPGYNPEDFLISANTRLFLGHEYCMIREKFLKNRIERNINEIKTIALSLGMSNSGMILNNTLKYCLKVWPNANFIVLPGNNKIDIPDSKRIIFKSNLNESEIIKLFDSVDVAIMPTSTLYMEALSRNTLVVIGYFVDNQKQVYNKLKINKYIPKIGDFRKLDELRLRELKEEIDLHLPISINNDFLGSGWKRIQKTINSVTHEKN